MKNITISKLHGKTHYADNDHAASTVDQSLIMTHIQHLGGNGLDFVVFFSVIRFYSNFPDDYMLVYVSELSQYFRHRNLKKKIVSMYSIIYTFFYLRILRNKDETHMQETSRRI